MDSEGDDYMECEDYMNIDHDDIDHTNDEALDSEEEKMEVDYAEKGDEFPTDIVESDDIKGLKSGSEFMYALVFKRNNMYCQQIKHGPDAATYVWEQSSRLWKTDESGVLRNKAITKTMLNLVDRAERHNQMSASKAAKLFKKFANIKTIRNMKHYINLECEPEFSRKLNSYKEFFPIKGGKKICLKTKKVSIRTKRDFFSMELDLEYLPNLTEDDNVFANFLKSIWTDQEEYEYWRKIHAVLALGETQSNYLIMWLHEKGGGGKTIWINSLEACLGRRFVTKLDRDILFRGCKKNKDFELAKLCSKRIAYVDEVSTDADKTPINLRLLLDLTGGGYRHEMDKYQKASSMVARKQTATVCLMGNNAFFMTDKSLSALNRRIIVAKSKPYFRKKGEDAYDPNDPWCKEKDCNLWANIEKNINHVFTFLMNCISDYINNGKEDLHPIKPESFRNAWKEINGKFLNTKKRILNEFFAECDESAGRHIELIGFAATVNDWLKSQYEDCDIVITCNDIAAYVSENSFGSENAIKVSYVYANGRTDTRKRYIVNIAPPQ